MPGDPPAVRAQALHRGLRSRGTFQFVLGAGALVFAVVAGVQGAAWWTVAIAAMAGALLIASGGIAWRVADCRLAALQETAGVVDPLDHGEGARGPDA